MTLMVKRRVTWTAVEPSVQAATGSEYLMTTAYEGER